MQRKICYVLDCYDSETGQDLCFVTNDLQSYGYELVYPNEPVGLGTIVYKSKNGTRLICSILKIMNHERQARKFADKRATLLNFARSLIEQGWQAPEETV